MSLNELKGYINKKVNVHIINRDGIELYDGRFSNCPDDLDLEIREIDSDDDIWLLA